MKQFYKCDICNCLYDGEAREADYETNTCKHYANRYVTPNEFFIDAQKS